MVKVLETQGTPNPDALKFIVDAKLSARGAKSFEDARAGEGDRLAKALFELGAVASVFYLDRFVTVTKFPDADWEEVHPLIVSAIEENAQPSGEAAPRAPAASGAAPAAAPAETSEDLLARIHQVLDENIRPALAGDGGGVEIVDFKDFVLSVHYQGACGSCPSSSAGTLFAIQNLLQRLVDERIQVVTA